MADQVTGKDGSNDDSVECEILPDGRVKMVLRDEMADFILSESAKRGLTPEEYTAQLLGCQMTE